MATVYRSSDKAARGEPFYAAVERQGDGSYAAVFPALTPATYAVWRMTTKDPPNTPRCEGLDQYWTLVTVFPNHTAKVQAI